MAEEHDPNEVDKARQKLDEAIRQLFNLNAEDRLMVFESLFGENGDLISLPIPMVSDGMSFACVHDKFQPFRLSDVRISEDGRIVLRSPNVFLSHSHSDKQFVRGLAEELRINDIKVWIDEMELHFGDSLIERLRRSCQ